MTRVILSLLASFLVLSGASLTRNERDRAMSELHASRKMLIDAASGLSQAQLNWKASPDRWSIAEVVEHLAVTETFLFGLYQQTAGSASVAGAKSNVSDEDFLKSIRTRDQKFKAPEPALPKKSFPTTDAALAAFKERRDKAIAYVESTQDQDLRLKIVPQMGMDAYQIFLMIAGHTQRHVAQIDEVKASPGYPRK